MNIVTGQGEESTPAPRPEAAPDNVTWASALMSALSTPVSLAIGVGILSEHRGTAVAVIVLGLLTALVGILVLVRVVRQRRKRFFLTPMAIVVSSVFAAGLIFAIGGGLVNSSPPGATEPTSPSAKLCSVKSGHAASFNAPADGAVLRGELTASGCAPNVAPGHVLWLYLYINNAGRYFPGDPNLVLQSDGQWTGTIYVGGEGFAGEPFELWLVELGTQALHQLCDYEIAEASNKGSPTGLVRASFPIDATFLTSVKIVGS